MASAILSIFEQIDKARASTPTCSCPACTGLECLERPRFFAGQLLSEADFNSEIDYILAKQRLHNRYLHGAGTVCGLEVVCGCDGSVIVKPGYAIDPCGNDIIVCQEQTYPVLKAIQDCCDARKKRRKTDCDPYQPANDSGCTGLVQHWCVTIQYQETPTQPITPLRSQPAASSCGCGNGGGTAKSNGCSGAAPNNGSSSTSSAKPISCEPTRILESFQLGVMEDPRDCATLPALLQDTLLYNLWECFAAVLGYSTKLSATSSQIVQSAVVGQLATSDIGNTDAYAACCQFRQFAVDLFADKEITTRCTVPKLLSELTCPQPPQYYRKLDLKLNAPVASVSDAQYLEQIQTTIVRTLTLLVEYFRECVCYQLLPPCPTDPGDNRLILACLTIKDGTITDICNFGCRQFAGGFPSLFYWLSLIPIVPLIKYLVSALCCGSAGGGRYVISDSLKEADYTRNAQTTFAESGFALPKMVFERFGDLAQKFSVQGIASTVAGSGLNLATVRGMSVENAQSSLNAFGVSYEVQPVNSRAEVPLLSRGLASPIDLVLPFAKSGDHVVLYTTGGNVTEIQRSAAAQPADVRDLRMQVESMRADLEVLKAARPGKKG